MNRRDTVLALAALGAAPLVCFAQAAGKIPRLCFLTFDPGTTRANRYGVFFEALRRLGYEDGKTIAIDYLSANERAEQFSAMAAECTRLKADVIVVSTTPAAQAAKKTTRTIPIVMLALGDPVGSGLIDSLARPGGNVTGMTYMAPVLAAKRLEMLKCAVTPGRGSGRIGKSCGAVLPGVGRFAYPFFPIRRRSNCGRRSSHTSHT